MICPQMSGSVWDNRTNRLLLLDCQKDKCQWWEAASEQCGHIALLAEIAAQLGNLVSIFKE